MEYIELGNGTAMPVLGLGVYRVTDQEECSRTVTAALHAGYQLIDTAAIYGNERAVGRGIAESGVARDQVFLSTKTWVKDYGYERTARAIDASLDRLGTRWVDLLLLHHPYGDVAGSWRALEAAVADGRARAIGVSNFLPGDLERLTRTASIAPMVNQIESHPYFQRAGFASALAMDGIAPEAWYPLGHGSPGLMREPLLIGVATAHGKSVAQVILRWHIQSGFVAIPKSTDPAHLAENIDVFDFALSRDEMSAIAGMDKDSAMFRAPRWLMSATTRLVPVPRARRTTTHT